MPTHQSVKTTESWQRLLAINAKSGIKWVPLLVYTICNFIFTPGKMLNR